MDGHHIKFVRYNTPAEIPWKDFGVDIVLETTGKFKTAEDMRGHMVGGAKKVILSAPASGDGVRTIVMGVNEETYNPETDDVLSNASCTTNCLAPFAKVLLEEFGIEEGLMTTVHAFTNDQNILDNAHKDLRRARTASASIIPTTTGAAKAVGLVLPALKGKLNGFALRVPTEDVSITDLVVTLGRDATVEEINAAMKKASETTLKGILGYSDLPLVSIDYRGCELSSVVDGKSTMMIGKRLAKVVAWYDNEWGYSCRLVDLAGLVASKM